MNVRMQSLNKGGLIGIYRPKSLTENAMANAIKKNPIKARIYSSGLNFNNTHRKKKPEGKNMKAVIDTNIHAIPITPHLEAKTIVGTDTVMTKTLNQKPKSALPLASNKLPIGFPRL